MAPHYVKKVEAQVEDDELKKEKKSKSSRPHSTTRMTKTKATQVSFDLVGSSVSGTVDTEEAGTQYEEVPTLTSCGDLLDKPEKVESVEISRVLLSGRIFHIKIAVLVGIIDLSSVPRYNFADICL